MTGAERALVELNALLNRFEANPSSARLGINIVRETFGSQGELDEYLSVLSAAEARGALQLTPRRGRDRHAPPKVQVHAPEVLYSFLGRTPSVQIAEQALLVLRSSANEPWMVAALEDVGAAWRRGRDWWGIGPDDASRIDTIAQLAAEIVAERHVGLDYRTLSVQIAKDSKFLENHEAALVRFLSFAREMPSGHPRAALSAIGLDRIAMSFHLSGPISIGELPIPTVVPYLGVPHGALDQVDFSRPPRCLLLIENFASFHRHAIEANAAKDDLVIYTGGQPSLSWQQSILELRRKLPHDLLVFHWSDIDWGGLEIFRKIEGLLGRVTPHLMSIEMAEEFGVSVVGSSSRSSQFRGSAVEDLANYLEGPDGKYLEQESLDPRPPSIIRNV